MSRDELKFVFKMDRKLLKTIKQLTIENPESEVDTVVDMDKAIREAFFLLLETLPPVNRLRRLMFGEEEYEGESKASWSEIYNLLK